MYHKPFFFYTYNCFTTLIISKLQYSTKSYTANCTTSASNIPAKSFPGEMFGVFLCETLFIYTGIIVSLEGGVKAAITTPIITVGGAC